MLEEVDLRTVRYHKPAGDWHESDFDLSESSDEAEDNKKVKNADSVKGLAKKRVNKADKKVSQSSNLAPADILDKSDISSLV